MKDERKIIRKVKFELYEMGYHTQTQENGLYDTYPSGKPTTDVFKDCINTVMVRERMFSTRDGQRYLRGAFAGTKAEFLICKVNKRGTQRFLITREEYKKIERKKFKQ